MSLPHSFLNHVISGDCLTVLPQLPAESVDMVLTDPPYLVRYQSRDGRLTPIKSGREARVAWPVIAR